jgi:hypothetical protein
MLMLMLMLMLTLMLMSTPMYTASSLEIWSGVCMCKQLFTSPFFSHRPTRRPLYLGTAYNLSQFGLILGRPDPKCAPRSRSLWRRRCGDVNININININIIIGSQVPATNGREAFFGCSRLVELTKVRVWAAGWLFHFGYCTIPSSAYRASVAEVLFTAPFKQ